MMQLTVPKKQPYAGSKTFYVSSEKEPENKYLVIKTDVGGRISHQYFCQCSDFFARRLPFVGTNLFSACKHSDFVQEVEKLIPQGEILVSAVGHRLKTVKPKPNQVQKQFKIEYESTSVPDSWYRSSNHGCTGLFDSLVAAERAIENYGSRKLRYRAVPA